VTSDHAAHAAALEGALDRVLAVTTYLLIGGLTGHLTDRLRRANRRLSAAMDALTERTRAVFEAEEQLRRADRLNALGQLSSGLAHEIRNPLGSIRGAAEILGDPEIDPAQRGEFSRVLIEETHRLDDVLKHFLDYTRSQKSDGPARCELAVVVERILTLLDQKLQSSGVRAELDLPADLPPLALAEGPMQQVMLNLALNAIQAMGDGGTLRIAAERLPDGRVGVTVSDTGPGIDPAARGRIFDPFFTTKPSGTGLGLSIAHQIVTGYGGRIGVEDAEPSGARLRLDLPAA
jgi:signal transduction histidine kinase